MAVITSVCLTLGSGVMFGRIRHTAFLGTDLSGKVEQLQDLPANVGSWELKDTMELDPRAADMLECAGYHFAEYENSLGQTALVIILLGPSGPTAVHTPEICYSSRDYDVEQSKQRLDIDTKRGSKSQLWEIAFRSTGLDRHALWVAYGWSTDGVWKAPDSPRRAFAGAPYLYKIQVAMPFSEGESSSENQRVLTQFCNEFIDTLDDELFRKR